MTQMSLFNRAELATMRDPTKARNYSAERDAFRRDHKRRRDHGKAQRHAQRIYRAFQQSHPDEPSNTTSPQSPATPTA